MAFANYFARKDEFHFIDAMQLQAKNIFLVFCTVKQCLTLNNVVRYKKSIVYANK